MSRVFARWRREPLFVFLVLGALIFGADRLLDGRGGGAPDERIVVSAERIAAFRADFRKREGRAPTDAELAALVDGWVEQEVLYRQALALGLDRDDWLVRRQMIRKMRYLLEDTNPLPEPTDAELRAWLEAHPERYGRPPTVSFDHVFIDRGHAGGAARAERVLAALSAGAATAATAGDPFPGSESVREADPGTLAKDFGTAFRRALAGLPEGQWRGPIRSRLGWHLVRVTERTPFVPATLETAGRKLRVEFRSHRRERANARAVAELHARFDVRIEDRSR